MLKMRVMRILKVGRAAGGVACTGIVDVDFVEELLNLGGVADLGEGIL